jgi:26S proteasome regulatory subunit N12
MAEAELQNLGKQLHQSLQSHNYQQCQQLLARAKVALLRLNALIPSPQAPKKHLLAARDILELGAIASIRMNNEQSPESFTRYFQQLQPFYALPTSLLPAEHSQQSRVTGLYLLLLLSTGDYGGFHTMLETLEMARASAGRKRLEDDEFIQYPVRLEQALMEGSYDRVWQQTKGSNVPGEEYAIFSGVRGSCPGGKTVRR